MAGRLPRWLPALAALAIALLAAAPPAPAADETSTAPNACVTGTPSTGWCGDRGPAVQARLANPGSLVVLPDGGFAFADMLNSAVREVTPAGTMLTLASLGGTVGCPPGQLALAPDGRLLVAAPGCGRVVAVAPDGATSVVAGVDPLAGPTLQPALRAPTGVAVTPDDTILIADAGDILRLDPTDVANGLTSPRRLRLHPQIAATTLLALPDGAVLAAGDAAGIIWRVNPHSGRTHIVLGHPSARRTRSGLLRTRYDPAVGVPAALAALPGGGFAFADLLHQRVREVSPSGHVRTVAGSGRGGFAGDGGSARDARLSRPAGVALRADGGLLIADAGNDRIRLVSPLDGTISTVAGSGEPPPPDDVAISPEDADSPFGRPVYPCEGGGYCPAWNYFYVTQLPLVARRGRSVSLHLITSRAADVAASVSHGGRTIRSAHARVGGGAATIRLGSFGHGSYLVDVSGHAGSTRRSARTALLVR